MSRDSEPRRIQSADHVCDILEHLRDTGSTTVSELADDIGLSTGTTHTYLATLADRGLVQKDNGEYRLSLELLPYGEHVRLQNDLYQAAKAEVTRLAHGNDGTAHLMTEYDGRLVVLHEVFGENSIGAEFHAKKKERLQTHLHCTAAGKSILAHLPDYRIAETVQNWGLSSYTSHTITDTEELAVELETIRERGFALNDQERIQGIRAVGAPILYNDERVLGAISLSGSASSWSSNRFREELPKAVMRVANAIEVNVHTEFATSDPDLI